MCKKVYVLIIMIILMAIPVTVFAGGQQEETVQEESNPLSPTEPTSINMIGWRFPITAFYAEELESLNSIKNLTVNTQLLDSGSAQDQVRMALSAGESPYEIVHADDAFLNELASEGWIMPLDDLIEKYKDEYDLDDISAAMYEVGSLDGKIYGIPITANSMNYFYNIEIFEKYGLEVPDTYDDVIAMADTLKGVEGIDLPFTINLHAGWAWRIEFNNFLKGYGGTWLNDDGSPAFNGPEGVKAVEKIVEVYTATMGKAGLNWSIDDSEIGLETGYLASAVTWTSRAPNMDDPEKSFMVGKIGFAPAPRVVAGGPHAGPAAIGFYTIPTNTAVDSEYIFKIIMQVADLESQVRASALGLVTRDKVAEMNTDGRYIEAALTTIANGSGNYGYHPASKIARSAIDNVLPGIVAGDKSAKEILDEAAALYIEEATQQGYL